MRRVLPSLLLVIAITASATAAFGQSEEEVQRAADLAEAAGASRASARAHSTEAERQLIAAVRRYESLTAEVTGVSFELARIIEETRTRESAYRSARDDVRRLIVAAYVAGAAPPDLLVGADIAELAFSAEVRARIAGMRADRFRVLDATSTDLDAQRDLLDGTRGRIAALRDEATATVPNMAALVLDARVQEAFALDQEAAAVARYELEAAELEAALALVSPRALRWKDLIEEHFPAEMTWAALQVLDCESGGDPDVVNDESGSTGLFQFLEGTWIFASAGAGFPNADRTDPEANVAAAAWLVLRSEALAHPRGAWGHWVCQPDLPEEQDE